jgi:predicted RNase H-like HicB family nuclease
MKVRQPNVESRWEPIPGDHPLAHLEGVTVHMEWDAESGAWVTHVPELNGIGTFGETQEEALENTRDMVVAYQQSAEGLQLPIPLSADEIRKTRALLCWAMPSQPSLNGKQILRGTAR